MAKSGKRWIRWAVIGMCMAWLLSLFGCGKGLVTDGPDMERELWQEFTISQTSDVYEQNYSYTVKYDAAADEGFLYMEVPHETKGYPIEKSIRLNAKTVSALFNLDLLAFENESPETDALQAEFLDGTWLRFSVTDENGTEFRKVLSDAAEQEILTLITPYVKKLKANNS